MIKRTQPRRGTNQSNRYLAKEDPLLKTFLSEIAKSELLSEEEQNTLIEQAQNGSLEARHKVGVSNCRLVVRIAREFQGPNLSINDLIQEGYTGLNESITKFNPKRKVPFANFASWWIKMRIMKYIWWNQTTIRLPETQRLAINKLLRISAKFISEHTRTPSIDELIEMSGLSEHKVKNYVNLFNCGNFNAIQDIDTLKDDTMALAESSLNPEELTDRYFTIKAITDCLNSLPESQREFLKDYYGIGRPVVSVKELAERSGSTTENIRQKRVKLIQRLKRVYMTHLAPYSNINNAE